ncbi:uncharacterized protein [Ptychodera flava]|uniref:uncharacterized protein isoform X2 n=1 Tax=Ptychodera flava TaxID=63121 RepID=UPI00396A3517
MAAILIRHVYTSSCLLVVCFILLCNFRCHGNLDAPCEEDNNGEVIYNACMARMTSLSNIAPDITVSVDPADATCGVTSYTRSCSMLSPADCPICLASLPGNSHPPDLVIDQEPEGTPPTFWQSVTWKNYPAPLEINLTLSLGIQYELHDDIKITFQSGLPRKMILEKSMDYGATWNVLQYYSADCLADFNMVPDTNLTSASEVICTERYSPVTVSNFGDDLEFSVNDRFAFLAGPENNNVDNVYYHLETDQTFNDFITLTDLRLRLLTPAYRTGATDALALDQYYYAISNIAMQLRCKCNLHGEYCQSVAGTVSCVCKHNTEGRQCDRCQPDYTVVPWQPGSYLPYPHGTVNECKNTSTETATPGFSNSALYSPTLSPSMAPSMLPVLPSSTMQFNSPLETSSMTQIQPTPAPTPDSSFPILPTQSLAATPALTNTPTAAAAVPSTIVPSITPVSSSGLALAPTPLPDSNSTDPPTELSGPCYPNPCLNGGSCVLDGESVYICICEPGYEGALTNCSVNIDECASNPCQQDFLCVDGVNGYTCEAPQQTIGPCFPNPCKQGGTCEEDTSADFLYRCQCAPGYEGPLTNCKYNIDECATEPCRAGLVCVDGINSYSCEPASVPDEDGDQEDPTVVDDDSDSKPLSKMMIIVICVCSAAVLFCIIWTVFFAWYTMLDRSGKRIIKPPRFGNPLSPMAKIVEEQKKKLKEQNQNNAMLIENASSQEQMGKKSQRVPLIPDHSSSVKMHALKAKWNIEEKNLKLSRLLENGEFCYIKEGQYTRKDESEVKVACKVLKDPRNDLANKELLNEFEILAHLLPDPRVVVLHGLCNIAQERDHFATQYCLVTEYVSNGSLLRYLRRCRSRKRDEPPRHSIPVTELMNIIVDVAQGMKFLVTQKIVHRKLAASNVLITFNNRAKISDFGLAADMFEFGDFVRTNEPVRRSLRRWLSYESLLDGVFSSKSDVWSYGILLWEIATLGSVPYPGISMKRLPEKLKDHYRMEKPKHVTQEYYDAMLRCWHRKPESRPSFDLLCKEMKKIQKTGKTHINLKDYTFVHYYSLRPTPDSDDEDDSFV